MHLPFKLRHAQCECQKPKKKKKLSRAKEKPQILTIRIEFSAEKRTPKNIC